MDSSGQADGMERKEFTRIDLPFLFSLILISLNIKGAWLFTISSYWTEEIKSFKSA